jgi:hypothetical protein
MGGILGWVYVGFNGSKRVRWENRGVEPSDMHFYVEIGMLIITYGQAFSYIRQSNLQLKG